MQAHHTQAFADPLTGDIVDALAGGQTKILSGFSDQAAATGRLSHPSAPFVPARQFDRSAPVISRAMMRWRRLVLVFTGLSLLAIGLAIGVLVSLAMVRWDAGPQVALPTWTLTQVTDRGVSLLMGERTSLIPIGGRLPNGDVVVSVFPNRNVVVLGTSTVMLRPDPGGVK